MKRFVLLALTICVLSTSAQNIVKNGDLQQNILHWNQNGCEPIIGGLYSDMVNGAPPYFFEAPHFNGLSATNILSMVSGCMNQSICLLKGQSYTFSFKHQRRSFADPVANQDPPATTSVRAIIRGLPSFTDYVNTVYDDSNPGWVAGWYNASVNFTIPAGSVDNDFRVIFVQATSVPTEFGCIIDDISVMPNPAFAVSGPTSGVVNTGTNWSLSNVPAGATYNWVFPGATPSSSTSATPTNIQWPTSGIKSVICTVSSPACATPLPGTSVATIATTITISGVLPVDMISFSAAEKQGGVDVVWTTANEINNDYFIVYKSKDGVNFAEAGRVNANAASGSGAKYRFYDAQPGGGIVYYKLRQVDKNGAYKQSDVVKLRLGSLDLDVAVYPTVISDVLNYAVQTPKAAKMEVTVTDMSGRRMVAQQESFSAGTNKKVVNATSFARGAYLLTVKNTTTGFVRTITFTKN